MPLRELLGKKAWHPNLLIAFEEDDRKTLFFQRLSTERREKNYEMLICFLRKPSLFPYKMENMMWIILYNFASSNVGLISTYYRLF